jgi:ubiquinol-cytochrome c reductase cytochrome b subunit
MAQQAQEKRGWLDERLDFKKTWDWFLNRKVPRGVGWWYVLGSASLITFLVLAITGIFLLLNYSPSPDHAYDSIQYNATVVPFGAFIRSMHFWAASAMVVLVVLHLLRVYFMAAYKYPREVNWILGAILLLLVMASSFTGYLLPWDQRAYWATNVASGIAGSVPLIGVWLQKLLIGGSQVGALTLTRFFAAHVGILPAFITVIIFIHVFIVIRLGISAPPGLMKTAQAPGKTKKEIYESQYEASKKGGESFFPSTIARDTVFGVLVVAVIIALSLLFPHTSEAPADPTSLNYNPRPEWYFLFLFQFLKLFPGSLESVAAVIIPGIAVIVLICVPFIDRGLARFWNQRKPALAIGGVVVGVLIALEVLGALAAPSHPTTPENQLVVDGQKVFRDINCSYCHSINGVGGAVGPDLSNIASTLTKEQITQYLQNPDSMVPNTLHPKLQFTAQELTALVAYLETLGAPVSYTAQAPQLFSQNCSVCHALNGQGGNIGPDLSREGSLRTVDFLKSFITDPKAADPASTMPAFGKILSSAQIQDLANYLYNQKAPVTSPSSTPTSTPTPAK